MSLSLLALSFLLQDPVPRDRPKPLIPPPAQDKPAVDLERVPTQDTVEVGRNPLSGAQQGNPFAAQPGQAAAPAPAWPRSLKHPEPLPFDADRPVLRVDGVDITTGELNRLVSYYRSFRPGSDALLLNDAVKALLPSKVLAARFAGELEDMEKRILSARQDLDAGGDWPDTVSRHSDDTEAPTEDARYTFGRERAVQPFDLHSFTTAEYQVTEPFLTVYGYHFLQVVGHEAMPLPAEDQVEVRHVLVMYPGLKELETQGQDIRAWIKEQVKAATIEVLEPGLGNLVPPENRAQSR
jgi:hypothetical protein